MLKFDWILGPAENKMSPLASFGSRTVGSPAEYKSLNRPGFGRPGRRTGGDSLVPSDVSNGPAPYRCRDRSRGRDAPNGIDSACHPVLAGRICRRFSIRRIARRRRRSPAGRDSGLIRHLAMASLENLLVHETTITCPECSRSEMTTMPAECRRSSYTCSGCGAILRPKPRDCCVYCSHSSVPCPSFQARLWRFMLELLADDDFDSADSNRLASDRIAGG